MPKTDFECVYPSENDLPSEIDVFNEETLRRKLRGQVKVLKKAFQEVAKEKERLEHQISDNLQVVIDGTKDGD